MSGELESSRAQKVRVEWKNKLQNRFRTVCIRRTRHSIGNFVEVYFSVDCWSVSFSFSVEPWVVWFPRGGIVPHPPLRGRFKTTMAFTYAPFVPGVVETQTPETENPTLLSPRWFHNKFTAFVTSSDHSAPRLRLPATLENWRSQKYSAEGALLPRCVSASTMYGTGLEEDADLAGGAGGAGARFEYEYAAPPPGQVRNDESASTRWRIYQVLASGVSGVGRWVVGTEHEKEAVRVVFSGPHFPQL